MDKVLYSVLIGNIPPSVSIRAGRVDDSGHAFQSQVLHVSK